MKVNRWYQLLVAVDEKRIFIHRNKEIHFVRGKVIVRLVVNAHYIYI